VIVCRGPVSRVCLSVRHKPVIYQHGCFITQPKPCCWNSSLQTLKHWWNPVQVTPNCSAKYRWEGKFTISKYNWPYFRNATRQMCSFYERWTESRVWCSKRWHCRYIWQVFTTSDHLQILDRPFCLRRGWSELFHTLVHRLHMTYPQLRLRHVQFTLSLLNIHEQVSNSTLETVTWEKHSNKKRLTESHMRHIEWRRSPQLFET